MDEVQIDDAVEEDIDPLDRYEPRKLNLRADLAIKLAFRSEGYPMADMILMISQITGVPIQLDWVSFDIAGTDVATRINPPKSGGSAREILDQIAEQVDATLREEETLLTFTVSEETFRTALAGIQNLDDFGDGKTSAADVLEDFLRPEPPSHNLIQRENGEEAASVNADPDKNAEPGGKPELGADDKDAVNIDAAVETVDFTAQRQAEQLAAIATETLRRMRGVPAKIADQRFNRWAKTSSEQPFDWPKVRDGETGPQPETPVSIAGFLRRLSRINDASCVVNWYDANRRRAMPERLLLPDTTDGLGMMLDQAFEPMRLYVRRVDPDHWWVGSDSTYDRLPVIVASRPLGDQRILFTQQVGRIMEGSDRNQFRMAIDDESDRAILMLPRYVVRQLSKLER